MRGLGGLLAALALTATAHAQEGPNNRVSSATHCNAAQQQAVDAIKERAIARLGRAVYYMGNLPEMMRTNMNAEEWHAVVMRKATQLFDDPHFDLQRGADTLVHMKQQLQHADPVAVCAPHNDRYCRSRDAYVIDGAAPIHLCPGFFQFEPGVSSGPNLQDKQTRILVHESAHLWGIGDPFSEMYCPLFDCQTTCGHPNESADSWSHFVHCVVGLPPDQMDGQASPGTGH